jgi:hypothetical protein
MKLQLKRSNVLDGSSAKEPTAVQMEYGELAVNYNNGDPAIFLKDNNDNIIRIAGSGSTGSGGNPSGPLPPGTGNQVGDLFFDTTNEILLYWNGSEWVPIASNETAADIFVGTLAEIDAEVPAADRRNGFLWWNTEDGSLYVWYKDGNTDQWVIANAGGGSGGGASVTISDTAPIPGESEDGDLWWDSSDGRLYIYYEDANSTQWVDASPDAQAPVVSSAPSAPTDPNEGDLWWNTTDGRLYIYYEDANSSQWVEASPQKDLSDTYVEKAGDTMTGDLKFNDGTTNNITLAASTGDLKFNNGTTNTIVMEASTGAATYQGVLRSSGNQYIGSAGTFRQNWQGTGGGILTMYVDVTPFNLCYSGGNNITFKWDQFSQVVATIDGAVDVVCGTGSDYRLKENVELSTYGTDAVKALRPVTYDFKESGAHSLGFIAHEAAEVLPNAATGEKDGEMMQSINTYPIVAALTKALQESITRIETLEAKVTSLEGGSN